MMNKIDIQVYLQRFDIDPDRVDVNGLTSEGYLYRRRTDTGQAIYEPGTRQQARDWKTWPEKFDFSILQHLIDGGKLSEKEKPEPVKVEPKAKAETPTKAKKGE